MQPSNSRKNREALGRAGGPYEAGRLLTRPHASSRRAGLRDLGTAIFLGGIAGGLHLIHDDVPAVWGLVARVAVVVILLLSLVGTGLAIARIAAALPERVQRGQGRGGITLVSVATALIGLATAIVNFLNTNN